MLSEMNGWVERFGLHFEIGGKGKFVQRIQFES